MKVVGPHEDGLSLEAAEATPERSALLSEKSALTTRVLILEAALSCIAREVELPETRPELSFVAVQRIGSVARQSLEPEEPG